MADVKQVEVGGELYDIKAPTSIAPLFSEESTYAVGDIVLYNDAFYRCSTAITTAAVWDSSKWTALDNEADLFAQYAASGIGFYGTCSTAAGTQTKAVVIPLCKDLTAGMTIRITFTNAQTYNGVPKLNVNSLGAKNMQRGNGTNAARYEWESGETLTFVYGGSTWIIIDGRTATTTYYGATKLSSSTTSTSTSLAATPSAVKTVMDAVTATRNKLVKFTDSNLDGNIVMTYENVV